MKWYNGNKLWQQRIIDHLKIYVNNPPKNCQKDKCWFWEVARRKNVEDLGEVWGSYCHLCERFNSPNHPICEKYDFTRLLLEMI